MPITVPADVRTPAQIAATRVAGEPDARCATCSFLLVELPRPVRLPIERPGRARLVVHLTHAHSTGGACPECFGEDAPGACADDHDAEPCDIAEPVACHTLDCGLPAWIGGEFCACCGT